MKILLLTPRFPDPHGKADSMTMYHLIKYMAQRHELYLISFYDDENVRDQHLPELHKLCRVVRTIRLNKLRAIRNIIFHFFNRSQPLQVSYYRDQTMQRAVSAALAEFKPDLAYAHLIRMAEYLRHVNTVPRVLAMQIAQTLNYRRMIQKIESTYYQTLYKVEYKRVCRYEPLITRDFNSCLLISEHDKKSLAGHEAINNIFYSPHGLDVNYYTLAEPEKKEDIILFAAVLDTPTNLDAVFYFYHKIYPIIRREMPQVKLYLVGKNPPPAIHNLAKQDASIVVTGYVKDLRPYYAKAKVGVDPLRIGAGLQNKLLVGMSLELPMVATTIANEGIGATPGEHLLLADDPHDFAARVVEIMRDDEKARIIGKQARDFVEKYWSWEYHFSKLEDHFRELVG